VTSSFFIGAIVFFAGFTQGLTGFGLGLVAMPLLGIFLDMKVVIPLVAIFNAVSSAILFLKLRSQIEYRDIAALLLFTLFGIPFGVYLLKTWDEDVIKAVLGLILIVYSIYSLFFDAKGLRLSRTIWAYPFGFLGGLLGGAFNTSGPPVIAYMSLKSWSKDRLKGTLQGYFVASCAMIVLFHVVAGVTTLKVLRSFLLFSPFLLFGVLTGSKLYDRMDTGSYRKSIFILLAVLGLLLARSGLRLFSG
jgi:hypothetical protein